MRSVHGSESLEHVVSGLLREFLKRLTAGGTLKHNRQCTFKVICGACAQKTTDVVVLLVHGCTVGC